MFATKPVRCTAAACRPAFARTVATRAVNAGGEECPLFATRAGSRHVPTPMPAFCQPQVVHGRFRRLSRQLHAKTLPGIRAPTGYFDPLQLAQNTTPDQVKRYREAELTHGRVCMLAALGILVGESVQDKSLFYNWDGGIQGPAIVHFQQTKQGFWEPLVLAIGICEALRVSRGWADPVDKGVFTLRDDYLPGDLSFDPLGICPKDEAEFEEMRTKELNNGRLAMIGTAGFVAQELVNKKGIFETLQEKL